MEKEKILICSAIWEELEGIENSEIPCLSLGVGNLKAGLNLVRFLEKNLVSEVIFLGSAGIYRTLPPPPSLALPTLLPCLGISHQFLVWDKSRVEGDLKIPELLESEIYSNPGYLGNNLLKDSEFIQGLTNCPNGITLSKNDWWAGIPNPNRLPIFENMETFGIASACQLLGVPFTGCYALTNFVGPEGSADWLKNYQIGAKILTRKLNRILDSLT
jgi:hypothetical protein